MILPMVPYLYWETEYTRVALVGNRVFSYGRYSGSTVGQMYDIETNAVSLLETSPVSLNQPCLATFGSTVFAIGQNNMRVMGYETSS